jgi:spore maturation protein CgeB
MFEHLLYIGSLDKKSNSFRRFQAYTEIIKNVEGIDVENYIYSSVTKKFDHHFNFGLGTIRLNLALRKLDFSKFNAVIVDNRPFLFKSTLRFIKKKNKQIKIANVLTDDPNGKYKSGWRLLKKTASLYDMHFVQRVQNIGELYGWGAKKVETCFRSFDPKFHRKKDTITKDHSYQVGFIGSYEEQREESIKFLIENGIGVNVTGNGWDKGKYFDTIKDYYAGPSVYGEAYVDKINAMPIALHFLRVGNRDEQDSRTFEIPACGTPMIAQYSAVHASLFSDHEEVLFFNNNQELLEKVNLLIANPTLADKLANAALKRCVISGYDHINTIKKVIEHLAK